MDDERNEDERMLAFAIGIVGLVAVLLVVLGGIFALVLAGEETGGDGTEEVADDLEADVRAALDDAGFGDVQLALDGDVVTLTGEVADDAARSAAVAAATAVPGVSEVVDELTVAGAAGEATGDDEEPTEAEATEDDPATAAAITATADGDTVTLAGTVPDDDVREQLLDFAGAELGDDVTVVDELEVDDTVALVDGTLTLAGSFDTEDEQEDYRSTGEALVAPLGVDLVDETELVEGADTLEELNALLSDSSVLFTSGSAELSDEASQVLADAAELLAAEPGLTVDITGHTDSSGGDAFNQQLSEQRAQAVADELVDDGVAEDQIGEVTGAGESEPIGDNATAEGRAQNRRIAFSTARG